MGTWEEEELEEEQEDVKEEEEQPLATKRGWGGVGKPKVGGVHVGNGMRP